MKIAKKRDETSYQTSLEMPKHLLVIVRRSEIVCALKKIVDFKSDSILVTSLTNY